MGNFSKCLYDHKIHCRRTPNFLFAILFTCLGVGIHNVSAQCPPLESSGLSGAGIYCEGSSPTIGLSSTNELQIYVFKKNGVPLLFQASGETGAVIKHPGTAGGGNLSYPVPNMSAADAGVYTVVTFNSCGDSLQLNSVAVYYSAVSWITITALQNNSVSFRWNSVKAGVPYAYGVTDDPYNPPGTTVSTTDTFGTVTGLTPGTVYYINVSVDQCDNGGSADWETLTFTTPADPCNTADPAAPVITTPGGSSGFCSGTSFILTSNSAQDNKWYKDSILIQGSAGTASSYSVTGTGKYMLQILDASGCFAFSPEKLITATPSPATPSISPAIPSPICSTDSVILTSSSSIGNQWFKDGNALANETNKTYKSTSGGSYTVKVTNAGCSSISTAVNLSVIASPPIPTISVNGPLTVCYGSDVQLTSSASNGNQWIKDGNLLTDSISQSITVKSSGTYRVLVTSSGLCQSSSQPVIITAINIQTPPTITASKSLTLCTNDSVLLSSSSATGNQWLDNGQLINGETGQTYLAKTAGNYTVQVTGGAGCNATSLPVQVIAGIIPPIPVITPEDDMINCQYQKILVSSSANGNTWFDNSQVVGDSKDRYQVANTGSYTLKVTNASGCSSTSAAVLINSLSNPFLPTLNTTDALTFCSGGSALLHSSAASGNQWLKDGIAIQQATDPTYSATASGSYQVAINVNGCTVSSNAEIVSVINSQIAPVISSSVVQSICAGDTATLTSSFALGNQWYKDGVPINGANDQNYLAGIAGSYTVQAISQGCHSPVSQAVAINVEKPQTSLTISAGGPLTFCSGGTVLLTASNAPSYQWFNNGLAIPGANNQTYTVSVSGNYNVNLANAGTCQQPSNPLTIAVVNGQMQPTINPSGNFSICQGDSLLLNSSSSTGNQWYLNGSAIPGATGKTYLAEAAGMYTIIVNSGTCQSPLSTPVTLMIGSAHTTPTISISGQDSSCSNDQILLTSSADEGNQWFLNGTFIPGGISKNYSAAETGNYSVTVGYGTSCASSSDVLTVTIGTSSANLNAIISVFNGVLSSDSVSGNQWYLNDSLIEGATGYSFVPTAAGKYSLRITSNGCISAFSAPFIVKESDLITPNVKIYPSPATDHITIANQTIHPITVQVFDIQGRLVTTIQGLTGTYQFNCANLTKGAYVVYVTDESTKSKTRKLILKQ